MAIVPKQERWIGWLVAGIVVSFGIGMLGMSNRGYGSCQAVVDVDAVASTYFICCLRRWGMRHRDIVRGSSAIEMESFGADGEMRFQEGDREIGLSDGEEMVRYRRDRKSTRLNSSHSGESRMPSSA